MCTLITLTWPDLTGVIARANSWAIGFICSFIHACMHTYTHTCTHAQIHTCMHTGFIHSFIHQCIHTHTCLHVRTQIHAYIHTYIPAVDLRGRGMDPGTPKFAIYIRNLPNVPVDDIGGFRQHMFGRRPYLSNGYFWIRHCMHAHTHIHIHMHTYIHICTHAYTYIHTYKQYTDVVIHQYIHTNM